TVCVLETRGVASHACWATELLERQGPAKALLGLYVILEELQMQRAQKARWLSQDRDDARGRLYGRDAPSCHRGAQILRRGLAHPLIGARLSKELYVLLEGVRALAANALVTILTREEPRLLEIRHEHPRVASQHLIQGSLARLGVPHDEEVRQPTASPVVTVNHFSHRCRDPR